ncbi:MAG: molybdenum ABC transporter ATP-binding protein [Paracoccaceae bacterium]
MTLKIELNHDIGALKLQIALEMGGGVTGISGPSGSGKTTLINIISGIIKPQSGRISLRDHVFFDSGRGIFIPPHLRKVGYIFQEPRLFPHLTLRQNLTYGYRFQNRYRSFEKDLDYVIDLLGLEGLLGNRIATLSGGEKQRVAIGRALMTKPDLFLMDEPLSALDYSRRSEILPYLARLHQDSKTPILYVSHAMTEIAQLADDMLVIKEGRVEAFGHLSQLLTDPDLTSVIGLPEMGAVLSGTLIAKDPDGLCTVTTPAGDVFFSGINSPIGSELRLRLLAQDVMVARQRPSDISALNILPARVMGLSCAQDHSVLVRMEIARGVILARITQRSAKALELAPGSACFAILKSVAVAQASFPS